TGLFFFAQAALLGLGMVVGVFEVTPRRLVAYVLALLVGWAAGATLGHLGKLLSLSVWAWWPPGPRPKQAALYPRRLWFAEAAAFALGIETAVDGVLAGSQLAVAAGGVLLIAAAAAAGAGLVCAGQDLVRAAIAAGEDDPDPERDLAEHRHGGDHPGQARPATAQGEYEQGDGDRGDRVGEHAVGDLQLGVTAAAREAAVAPGPLRPAGAVGVGGDDRRADG